MNMPTISADEVVAELQAMVPETVDRAALRIANRKLLALLAEHETKESPNHEPNPHERDPYQSAESYLAGVDADD